MSANIFIWHQNLRIYLLRQLKLRNCLHQLIELRLLITSIDKNSKPLSSRKLHDSKPFDSTLNRKIWTQSNYAIGARILLSSPKSARLPLSDLVFFLNSKPHVSPHALLRINYWKKDQRTLWNKHNDPVLTFLVLCRQYISYLW